MGKLVKNPKKQKNKGLIISRPELLRDLADEIFTKELQKITKGNKNVINHR